MKKLSDHRMYKVLKKIYRDNKIGDLVNCRDNFGQAQALHNKYLIREKGFGYFVGSKDKKEEAEKLMIEFEVNVIGANAGEIK